MKSKDIKILVLLAFFVAIEVILANTPLGYVPIGAINATTLHIPVIIAGILLGKKYGALIGFVFGLTSFMKATFQPGITSFIFSPFYSLGEIHGNFFSLVLAFGPRILLGYLSGLMFEILPLKADLKVMISAGFNTLLHTLLVMGGVYVFFADEYAKALNVSISQILVIITTVIMTNGIAEIIIAVIASLAVYRACYKIVGRMIDSSLIPTGKPVGLRNNPK